MPACGRKHRTILPDLDRDPLFDDKSGIFDAVQCALHATNIAHLASIPRGTAPEAQTFPLQLGCRELPRQRSHRGVLRSQSEVNRAMQLWTEVESGSPSQNRGQLAAERSHVLEDEVHDSWRRCASARTPRRFGEQSDEIGCSVILLRARRPPSGLRFDYESLVLESDEQANLALVDVRKRRLRLEGRPREHFVAIHSVVQAVEETGRTLTVLLCLCATSGALGVHGLGLFEPREPLAGGCCARHENRGGAIE